MSISSILVPNNYELLCRSIVTKVPIEPGPIGPRTNGGSLSFTMGSNLNLGWGTGLGAIVIKYFI